LGLLGGSADGPSLGTPPQGWEGRKIPQKKTRGGRERRNFLRQKHANGIRLNATEKKGHSIPHNGRGKRNDGKMVYQGGKKGGTQKR